MASMQASQRTTSLLSTIWPHTVQDLARVLLASTRLFNGAVAVVAPRMLAGHLGPEAESNPALFYVFRMFGIRTVLIGVDLLRQPGERRTHAVQAAPLIHASDTLAAALAAASGRLPRGSGLLITGISALNTILALVARSAAPDRAATRR